MKKLTAALLVVLLILSMMSGCGKKQIDTNNSTDISGETEESGNNVNSTENTENKGNNPSSDKTPNKNNNKNENKENNTQQNNTSNNNQEGSSDDNQQSSDNKPNNTPSSNSNNKKPSSSGGMGSIAGGGTSVTYDPSDWEQGDADLEDFVPDATDGKIDQSAELENDGVKYHNNVETSMKYTEITKDTYDEAKFTLPVVNIDTLDKADVTSKTTYKSATITISNTSAGYQKQDFAVEIRGRGNSTWNKFDKKPYKLKFAMKTDMFGMGAAKKWVLLANAMDETMVRNYLAFSLAKKLGLEFTSEYQFINLYINGTYKGVYILCEQLQEGATRVDINTSNMGVVDTGYLIEGTNNAVIVEERTFTVPPVSGKILGGNSFNFIVKSPDALLCNDEQLDYIENYVTQVNEAIFTKNWAKITELVDINSFVNMFILDMVTLNNDMGYSFYMYKKAGGKLYLGPMWDYDQSFGNSSHGGSGYKGWYAGSEHQWYTTLIQMDEFKTLVANRYKDKKNDIRGLVDEIDNVINKNSYDFAMNNYLWGYNFGSPNRWRITPQLVGKTTYKQNVEFLKTWLSNRLLWMENKLGVK